MDFNINKIYTSIYIGGGDLILREPFNATNKNETLTFTTGDHFIHFNAGIKVGYFGVRTNKIHIAVITSYSIHYTKLYEQYTSG